MTSFLWYRAAGKFAGSRLVFSLTWSQCTVTFNIIYSWSCTTEPHLILTLRLDSLVKWLLQNCRNPDLQYQDNIEYLLPTETRLFWLLSKRFSPFVAHDIAPVVWNRFIKSSIIQIHFEISYSPLKNCQFWLQSWNFIKSNHLLLIFCTI